MNAFEYYCWPYIFKYVLACSHGAVVLRKKIFLLQIIISILKYYKLCVPQNGQILYGLTYVIIYIYLRQQCN